MGRFRLPVGPDGAPLVPDSARVLRIAGFIGTFALAVAFNLAVVWVTVVFGVLLFKAIRWALKTDQAERATRFVRKEIDDIEHEISKDLTAALRHIEDLYK